MCTHRTRTAVGWSTRWTGISSTEMTGNCSRSVRGRPLRMLAAHWPSPAESTFSSESENPKMPKEATIEASATRDAFLENERLVRIQNYRVACMLALISMPAGVSLDYLVYRPQVAYFFKLRLL